MYKEIPIIGIDFGMSNTSISYIYENSIKLIPDEMGRTIIPTTVFDNEKNTYHRYFKRTIASNELSKQLTILFFKNIKQLSENHLNTTIDSCILSIPVYWDWNEKKIIQECCQKAGLSIISFVEEPIAGILSLFQEENVKQQLNSENLEHHFIVIDCGGGTTDLSFVTIDTETNCYEVNSTLGDNNLGGEDITFNLFNYIQQKHKLHNYPNSRLINHIKKSKETLSYKQNTIIYIDELELSIPISRNELIEANKKWISKFQELLQDFKEKCIKENYIDNFNKEKYYIILIGGTTKIPKIKEIVSQVFFETCYQMTLIKNNENIISVAIGCSYKGKMIYNFKESREDITLLQKLNKSIGVEVENGEMAVIISKDSYIPISKTKIFLNTEENDEITIKLYSGERRYVKDNDFIGIINISFIEKKKRGLHKIELKIEINESSFLNVYVKTSENKSFHNCIQYDNQKKYEDNLVQLFEEKLYDIENEK